MLFEVTRKLLARSERVKGVDFHPTEPWLLAGLYSGIVSIYNLDTGATIKTFEVSDVPVRCVKFIARKNWFVAGSDDYQLRVFNYNTHEKVTQFEAHPDYIRCLTVHPTLPIVLTGSDDMTIKAWDWEKHWRNVQTYEGHTHYVMNIAFNPKDPNTFVSACLDRTVKMWSIGASAPNFTMEAHDKGVNYVDFYPGADKPYLVTTGDDKTVKVWDYLSKSCVQTMEGHTNNVSFAVFHPHLPIIISGSEDGTVKFWNSATYRIENTLNYSLERAWCLALRPGTNEIAVGFDEGVVTIKLGKDEPTFSVDHANKLLYTRNLEAFSGNLQTLNFDAAASDGARIPLPLKEIGLCEIYPTTLQHSPNGRFVTLVGDGEYVIYTALAWRNKSFGKGLAFAWAPDSNTYAALEGKSKLAIYKNFKEKEGSMMKGSGSFAMNALHPGPLLSARGPGYVMFWDWETGEIVRRIDVDANNVHWSTSGTLVAITAEESFYVLRFDRDAYQDKIDEGVEITDEGVEEAFELVTEINDSVKTAKWVGDCFIYTTSNRLCYLVGTESHTISPFDSPLYLLGYVPAHDRVYLVDNNMKAYVYTLSLKVVEYQTAVLRDDLDVASNILPTVPKDQLNKVARFLEGRGHKKLALQITTDPEHKFDLALSIGELDTAHAIVKTMPDADAEMKWKELGDKALHNWNFELAKESYKQAEDIHSLFLLVLSMGDRQGVEHVVQKALDKGQNNLAFAALLQLGNPYRCVDLLIQTGRAPEAAMFARTYCPSKASDAVKAWKADLRAKGRQRIADSIADPEEYPELFEEGWQEALAREKALYGSETDLTTKHGALLSASKAVPTVTKTESPTQKDEDEEDEDEDEDEDENEDEDEEEEDDEEESA